MFPNVSLQKGILTSFFTGWDQANPQWDRVATKVPSTARQETYAFLGSLPRMRKQRGERIPQKLKDYGYTLVNEEFEASIEVQRADLKDDQTGKFAPLAQSIGQSARMYPDEQIFGNLLPAGFASLCYDGQYFFDTDHPIGDTGLIQSNTLSGALTSANYQTARSMLRRMQDDFGTPINQNASLLLVIPPELEATANNILKAEYLASGATNTDYNTADVLVSPWLTSATHWYLFDTSGIILPFIVQEREFIPIEALEDNSESSWWRKTWYYGTYWRGNFGYGLYQKVVGSSA
jgi:phage major head subunit gpT-like protein